MIKKTISLLVLIPVVAFSLTLEETVYQTVETNPLIKIKNQKKLASEKKLRQEYSGYLPTLDLIGDVGVERTEIDSDQGDLLNKYDTSIALKENIFRGFDTVNNIESKKARVTSSKYKVEDEANTVSLKAIIAYLNILRAKELVQTAQNNVDAHTDILTKIEKKVNAGIERQSMYDQTLSRAEDSKSTLLFEQQNYQNAIENFKRVLDVDITADNLEAIPKEELTFESKESLIDIAFENNPMIKYGMYDIEESKAEHRLSGSKYYPTIDLKAEAKFRNNINGAEVENNSVAGLIVFNYNLYSGGLDQATREENMHVIYEQQAKLLDYKSNIKEKVSLAWNTYEYSSKQLIHLKKHIDSSEKTVKDYYKEYELGRRSLLDLLNSELEFNSAKNKSIVAFYRAQQAYYEMLAYSGTLLEKFEIVIE